MERICAKCGATKDDCLVTIADSIKCKKETVCSSCRAVQSGDEKLVSTALDMFAKAADSKTAGGGLNGYKFMLELIASQMAEEHGCESAIKRLQLIENEIKKQCK
ncbi:MAG TPA: hypothetical protein VK448_04315 [Dissulfurispiraceae bacterium]|nr:hypothetical protein [Dissulfurispiraceae bacterium]